MKVLGIIAFGNVKNVERDNSEPRLSKVNKMLSLWRFRSLSLVGKVLILNTLDFSKLFYLSRILEPPKWVYGRIKGLIWPFFCGALGSRPSRVDRLPVLLNMAVYGSETLHAKAGPFVSRPWLTFGRIAFLELFRSLIFLWISAGFNQT